jgi:hypothetical protein
MVGNLFPNGVEKASAIGYEKGKLKGGTYS